MAGKKKFGAFAGVFTPSILTILGVIMYMRMGWVVGNAGLIGTLVIVTIAHVISLTTGLSVSSIATDKKVGAGGIYYILSRSMGIPIGGAIGITLYVGTALSIALYLIGFAESFNGYFDLDTGINGLRISGSVALLILTAIALISTSVALKTQFFILIAIIISLVAIFFGSHEFAPQDIKMFSDEGSVSMELVFAIFFPAVTGFTAGIAMSGDLKDPKKSIPSGTLAAIAVGFIVYIGLTFFLAHYINADLLSTDNNIMIKIALFAPAVVAGVWGATLSSALGGILGGPRILQAMSVDNITPRIFGRGKGKNNEPVNALILVFVIAQLGVLIGELDVIARVVSMFYLAAYGFINLSFFLESWANPDFQPTFKVKRWVGLIGFIACFGVMFKLDMIAMFASIIIIMGIYFWLQRKRIMLDTGDVWKSVWENVVAKGLKKLETNKQSINWNPNIILFGGPPEQRPHLLEFSKAISGRTGIVTNFNLIIKDEGSSSLTKLDQTTRESILEELGIFGRRIEVSDIYQGVQNVAATFGFSGVDPNTIMMGWPKRSENPKAYAQMTKSLIQLDYNLFYLDYDLNKEFGRYKTIDFWWRETDNNNAELMLNIARFIIQSPNWSEAKIRVLFVNHNNVDNTIIRSKITQLTSELRVETEILIINNGVDQKPFYKIIERESASTDLIVLGIPNIQIEKQAEFILHTNHLFERIGSTLLVKAAHNFNEIQLDFAYDVVDKVQNTKVLMPLPISEYSEINNLISEYDQHLSNSLSRISSPALKSMGSFYGQFLDEIKNDFEEASVKIQKEDNPSSINVEATKFIERVILKSEVFRKDKLVTLNEIFSDGILAYLKDRELFFENAVTKVHINSKDDTSKVKTIYWKKIIYYFDTTRLLPNTQNCLYNYGYQSFDYLNSFSDDVTNATKRFIEKIAFASDIRCEVANYSKEIVQYIRVTKINILQQEDKLIDAIKDYERKVCIDVLAELESIQQPIYKTQSLLKRKDIRSCQEKITNFGNDWYRNQQLLHQQLEAQMTLCISSCTLLETNSAVVKSIRNEAILQQLLDIKSLSHISESLSKTLNEKQISDSDNKILFDLNKQKKTGEFNAIKSIVEHCSLPISSENIVMNELMSATSYKSFLQVQNDDLTTVLLDIKAIENHIIQSSYVIPTQQAIQALEEVYMHNSEELHNSANLIQHVIEESVESDKVDHYQDVLQGINSRLQKAYNKLEKDLTNFQQDTTMNLHDAIQGLNVISIIDSSEILSRASQKPALLSKVQNWVSRRQIIANIYYGKLVSFLVQRKQDIEVIKFDEKHEQYQNVIEQTNRFVERISIKKSTNKSLPYYYKKLFTGGHLNNALLSNRSREMTIGQNALTRISEGANGGIMILGEALSGKTYFSENLAKTINGNYFVIQSPTKISMKKSDMHKALQKTFGMKGNSEVILSQVEAKSILLFNDIENWWVKAKGGSELIDYLGELINEFGHRFYFILNCNIHSFDIIRKSTNIESHLLSTIIMSPLSRSQVKNIIWDRHRTAGLSLYLDHEVIKEDKKYDKIFSNIYRQSQGVIGVTLNNWISDIELQEDQLVIQNRMDDLAFPIISNAKWKLVLYHLLIHNKVTIYHLDVLFDLDNKMAIIHILNEMISSGLVKKDIDGNFKLNSVAKHYVEQWFKSQQIVN